MNKKEFLSRLEQALAILQEEELRDILDEYEQHIDMKMKSGLSEAEAIADFGDFRELTADILEAYHVRTDYASVTGKGPGGNGAASAGTGGRAAAGVSYGGETDRRTAAGGGQEFDGPAGEHGGRLEEQTSGGPEAYDSGETYKTRTDDFSGRISGKQAGGYSERKAEEQAGGVSRDPAGGDKTESSGRGLYGSVKNLCGLFWRGLKRAFCWTWEKTAHGAVWLWKLTESAVIWSWNVLCTLGKWSWKALCVLAARSWLLLCGMGRWSRKALRWSKKQLCRPFVWLTGRKAVGRKEGSGTEGYEPDAAGIGRGKKKTVEKEGAEMYAGRSLLSGAGRGIRALCRWCAEVVVWWVRLFWNIGCICGVLLVGMFGMCGLFFLGMLAVLLHDGYPLWGVTLICFGITASLFALVCFGLTLLWRGQRRTVPAESGRQEFPARGYGDGQGERAGKAKPAWRQRLVQDRKEAFPSPDGNAPAEKERIPEPEEQPAGPGFVQEAKEKRAETDIAAETENVAEAADSGTADSRTAEHAETAAEPETEDADGKEEEHA